MVCNEPKISRRWVIQSFLLPLLFLSGCTGQIGKRGDVQLINHTAKIRNIQLAVQNSKEEVVFERTYELESGDVVLESNVLGWDSYTIDLTTDGKDSAMSEYGFSTPNCLSPVYMVKVGDDYYADFELSCDGPI